MFILRYGVAFIAGYILIAAHTLPTSISRKSLSFPTFGNAKEPKWLIESNDYPKIKPQDLKAFFSSELILEATGAQKGGQRGRDSDLHATSSNDDLLAIKHITNHKGRSGNMIVNFLRKKQPTNVDYAKVQVLKDINEYVDSGKIAGLGENPAFIMNGNSAGTKSVPLEEVKFSNAQKKQAKKEIANLACDKVIEVAKKYHVFYMGFKPADILITPSKPSTLSTPSSLSPDLSPSSSPLVVSVDLLGWDRVKKIAHSAQVADLKTYCGTLFDSEYVL